MVQINIDLSIQAQRQCINRMNNESAEYRNSKPPLTRPNDFQLFWQLTLEMLAQQPLDIQLIQQETRPDGLTLQWLDCRSFGGAVIRAYCLKWNDEKPRPLLIHSHGYVGQCEVMWQWAERGLNVCGFDIRGLGRSQNAIYNSSDAGYVLTGIDSPQTSVLRGAVCDYIRAHDLAQQCLNAPPARTIFSGHSFSGALALMAAAVTHTPDLLIAGVPTLGWAEARRRLVHDGSGLEINRYLEQYPVRATRVMNVLRYFDSMNFANMIDCPALIGLGVQDEIVPAPTVYAIINHLTCPHEVREFPVSHTNEPEEELWSQFENEWLELAVNGVPESFGVTSSPVSDEVVES